MLVRHAMVRAPYCVGPDALCLDVLREFRQREVRHAPVVREGRLVGVVSERDLVRALPRLVSAIDTREGRRDAQTLVRSVMAATPVTCEPGDALDIVTRRMEEHRIGCMPVVSEGALVGIVTVNDVLRGFTQYLADPRTRAITLMWTRGDADDAPDVLTLCSEHDVHVSALLESETDAGARVILLRVRGDARQTRALAKACVAAGLLLIDERAAA